MGMKKIEPALQQNKPEPLASEKKIGKHRRNFTELALVCSEREQNWSRGCMQSLPTGGYNEKEQKVLEGEEKVDGGCNEMSRECQVRTRRKTAQVAGHSGTRKQLGVG